MSNPTGHARSAELAARKAAPESRAGAMTRQAEGGGAALLQQMAGNRLVGSLFDAPIALEREAERAAAEPLPVAKVTPLVAGGNGSATRPGGGSPLAAGVLRKMESRFAVDLSSVRVHDDDSARQMAEALDARAFTLGEHMFFNAGLGPANGAASHVLLAHELSHVLQQRNGGVTRIQRAPKNPWGDAKMPSGGAPQPATPEIKRDFVQETVKYLNAMADFYQDKIRIAQVSKTTPKVSAKDVLPKWKKTIETDITLLDPKTDAKLLDDLKTAYRNMVQAVVRADSLSQSTDTLHQTCEKYRADIHEWGWPVGSAEPTANTLSDAIPEAERGKIKVITNIRVTEGMLNLPNAFSTIAKSKPPDGVHLVFAGTIAPKLQQGLTEVGTSLIQNLSPPPLRLNSTITLALDLGKYVGDYALFRFTYFQHTEIKDKKKATEKQLIIERLGTVGLEGLRDSSAAWTRFHAHGFKFSGQWKSSEKEAVVAATQLLPDSQLTMVDGITFDRQPGDSNEPDEAGHYEVETHAVALYDRAFRESAVRFGAAGASLATQASYYVVHEIGHAIDRRKYRAALTAKEAAAAAVWSKFGQYGTKLPGGGATYEGVPGEVLKEFNQLMGEAQKADVATTKVVTESGERFQGTDLKDDLTRKLEFRTAGAGTRISPYADQKWREYFAESFALYTTEPATLQRLRPKLYDYFVKNYPR